MSCDACVMRVRTGKDLHLRERTRRAVQLEIAEVATALFVERGFDQTTIDDVAATVGVSRRSVFRYFATKEDIVLSKFELVGQDMLAALRARPANEAIWTSLQRMFDVVSGTAGLADSERFVEAVHRLVFETPTLLAGYLERLQHLQDAVTEELIRRAHAAHRPYSADDPTPRAVTAAAFGCYVAAQRTWLASGAQSSFAEAVESALMTITPRS